MDENTWVNIWEKEMEREEKNLQRMRQVFMQRMIVFSLCFIFVLLMFGFIYNTLHVQAKEAITFPVVEAEPLKIVSVEIPEEVIENVYEEDAYEEPIIPEEDVVEEVEEYVYNISDEDKLLFKRIISAESYGFWSYQDCLSLATVVTNRLDSESFPHSDSIREILTTKNQFETYSNGRYLEVEITEAADEAVEAALKGNKNLNSDVMYFCTSEYYSVCSSKDFFKSNLGEPVYQVRNVLFFEEP